jgi:hypothetical protein
MVKIGYIEGLFGMVIAIMLVELNIGRIEKI